MLFALATSHKIGLALAAALFVVFALISALWLPRLRPDFPGPKLKVFLAVCVLITLVMLGAVIALAKEPKEKEAAVETTAAASTASGPAATSPAPTGNAANGKAVFAAQGCAACHTFTPAGSKATIGPDLDKLASDAQAANRGSLAAYTKESVVDPNAYVVPKFPKGVMPQDFGTKLSPSQLNDLIAFLTQK